MPTTRIACESPGEVSCLAASLISELTPPCEECCGEAVALCGVSPLGGAVTLRFFQGNIMEIEGDSTLLNEVLERRKQCGKEWCGEKRGGFPAGCKGG